jgi:hypothetical protein
MSDLGTVSAYRRDRVCRTGPIELPFARWSNQERMAEYGLD